MTAIAKVLFLEERLDTRWSYLISRLYECAGNKVIRCCVVKTVYFVRYQVLFYLWWIKHVLKFEKFRNNTTRIVVMEKSKGNCVIIGSWTDMYWIEFHRSGNHYIIYKISALTLLNLIFRKWHFLNGLNA